VIVLLEYFVIRSTIFRVSICSITVAKQIQYSECFCDEVSVHHYQIKIAGKKRKRCKTCEGSQPAIVDNVVAAYIPAGGSHV